MNLFLLKYSFITIVISFIGTACNSHASLARSVVDRTSSGEVIKQFENEAIPPATDMPLGRTLLPDDTHLTLPFTPKIEAKVDSIGESVQKVYWEKLKDSSGHICIQYKQPVNGYEVKVLFSPDEFFLGSEYEPSRVIGIGIIYIATSYSVISVAHNNFFIQSPPFDVDSIYEMIGKTIYLDYEIESKTEDEYVFFPRKTPFFFTDVNLDGRIDFLLTNYHLGQKGVNSYLAYYWDEEFDNRVYPIGSPFNDLDALTKINKETGEVIQTFTGNPYITRIYRYGDCYSYYLEEEEVHFWERECTFKFERKLIKEIIIKDK
ncbi:hypothetical protein [Parabacteroides sp. PF5-6]|uniref:hypothetical protein n=1 Tax=Parabacteroides sp. PF5-6 TaxID=1742403 RepID=UPI0024061B9A|nr:hypothetical protein [Parabacteroides sp. PF5-6]MDF9828845.1 hypothetical protein [Parabacteroides sp. PF5-6]